MLPMSLHYPKALLALPPIFATDVGKGIVGRFIAITSLDRNTVHSETERGRGRHLKEIWLSERVAQEMEDAEIPRSKTMGPESKHLTQANQGALSWQSQPSPQVCADFCPPEHYSWAPTSSLYIPVDGSGPLLLQLHLPLRQQELPLWRWWKKISLLISLRPARKVMVTIPLTGASGSKFRSL